MTCTMQRKDPLFHVLFGGNTEWISRLIEESVLNIAADYPHEGLADSLQFMRPSPSDSLTKLQIKFFALLNEDSRMRSNFANVRSHVMTSLCPHKSERFYDALCDELMTAWIKDESMPDEDFVDAIRKAYLNS
jgi:hypothetical protein